jgi:soluble lytic murein transglycosylase-like protein
MSGLMEKFEKLFLIRELLGEDMAFAELAGEKYYPKSLKGWVAFAELYKRLGAYNRAYQVYDYIDNKFFGERSGLDKPFLLKESYPLYYDNFITSYSDKHNIDKNLILALIRQESGYNRLAHSWANAYGLMQIIPSTAEQLAGELRLDYSIPERLFDAEMNINMGTYYLRKLLDRYEQRIEFALAAYNAGPHRVQRWRNIMPSDDIDFFVENIEFSQTRNYVRLVMRNYWIYSILANIN